MAPLPRWRPLIEWGDQPIRSLLFAPGSEPRKLARVGTFGSDAVILDLEDAVAEDAKDDARCLVADAVSQFGPPGVLAVRVNPPDSSRLEADLEAVVHPNLDCVVLPKVEDQGYLDGVDSLLSQLEAARSIPNGHVRLVVTLETARGVADARAVLASERCSPRLAGVLFGSVDFVLDTGLDPGVDEIELLYPRSCIVLAARAAGVTRVLDGPWTQIEDLIGLEQAVHRSRRLGFTGRGVIHPSHVTPVQHGWWALSQMEAEKCGRIVSAFEESLARGAASIRVGEQFVDYPVYHRAQKQLARHLFVLSGGSKNE